MFRTALILMFTTSVSLADTWTVDDDGKADFDNIQAAVNAASSGDEIIVMPGTYTGIGDYVVNMNGSWIDGGGNTIAEDCSPCLADIALDDGQVNVHDLLSLTAVWGTDSSSAYINSDGIVNVHDLLMLIGAWGVCP